MYIYQDSLGVIFEEGLSEFPQHRGLEPQKLQVAALQGLMYNEVYYSAQVLLKFR